MEYLFYLLEVLEVDNSMVLIKKISMSFHGFNKKISMHTYITRFFKYPFLINSNFFNYIRNLSCNFDTSNIFKITQNLTQKKNVFFHKQICVLILYILIKIEYV